MKSRVILFALTIIICFTSCSDNSVTNNEFEYEYTIPLQTEDGWEVASLTDVSIDETSIILFINDLINSIDHRIHSILIIKDGKLVFEEYFPGYKFYHGPLTDFNRETRHSLASVTKSFTSAIVGVAFDRGFIQNLDQKIFSFFPEYSDLNSEGRDEITLEHLLTMSAGLEWDESSTPYSDPRNDLYQIWRQSDPIRFVLDNPVVTEPGTQFYYNSGLTNVLGEIVHKTAGVRADYLARDYLFSPLGITDYSWEILPNNVLYTSGDLQLRPRDVAKLGELYLRDGVWNEQQIISSSWIEASTNSSISVPPDLESSDYGYQWWLATFEVESQHIESYSARGWGGQNIIVFPSLNMVVVTTAGYYDEPQLEFHIGGLLIPIILSATL
ncbi:MAG: serine hydrolase [Ignavibacteria bacterium]|jgi:CubicO group peptidase (beta-lactamase class C family)